MNNTFISSTLVFVTTALLVLFVSCDQNAIATKQATAYKKAAGSWQLVSITSGWTGRTIPPDKKVEMTIDQQQQGIIYENGKEAVRYQYTVEETSSGTLRYSIVQQTGIPPIVLQSRGNFRVSSKQLIMGDIGTDGNDYTFERN